MEINPEEEFIKSAGKAINQAAKELGRKGGLSQSELKRTASRLNGKKGGRPKKTQV